MGPWAIIAFFFAASICTLTAVAVGVLVGWRMARGMSPLPALPARAKVSKGKPPTPDVHSITMPKVGA